MDGRVPPKICIRYIEDENRAYKENEIRSELQRNVSYQEISIINPVIND